jgi:thiamine-phosphate pyrophosphorylase
VTGAAGVQLPADGLPVEEVRRAFPALAIGASCHSLAEARRAEGEGADFVVLGPVFPTPGKETRVLGVEALAETVRTLRIPVHAVGGVDASTARIAAAAGAAGVLAIRAFLARPVAEAVRALREAG